MSHARAPAGPCKRLAICQNIAVTDRSPPARRHWSAQEREAFDRLQPLMQAELLQVALTLIRGKPQEHRREASALAQAALIRLSQRYVAQWHSRVDFYRWAAGVMRHVLIDHARAQRAAGPAPGIDDEPSQIGLALMAIDDALRQLERLEAQVGFADTTPMPPPSADAATPESDNLP